LRSLGLDPEKDATIITLGTDTLRHAALIAGTVQATHMPVPLNIQLKKAGYHELVYAGKILQRPLTDLATSLEKISMISFAASALNLAPPAQTVRRLHRCVAPVERL